MAFQKCELLRVISFPPQTPKLKTISMGAFFESGLQSIVIPEGVEILERAAFYNCDNLASVTLPNTLRVIGEYCFANCKKLLNIYNFQDYIEMGEKCFENCNTLLIQNSLDIASSRRNRYYPFYFGDVFLRDHVNTNVIMLKEQQKNTLQQIEERSHMSIKDDATGYDMISGETYTLADWLDAGEDDENFVIVQTRDRKPSDPESEYDYFIQGIELLSRETWDTVINDSNKGNNFKYRCFETGHMRTTNIDRETPYILMRSFTSISSGIISVKRIQTLLDEPHSSRIFQCVNTGIEFVSICSHNVLFNSNATHVSSSHCQEGQNTMLYTLVPMKLKLT